MSGKKKLKASDIIMDCIIGGVALVLLIVLLTVLFKDSGNKDTDKKKATESTTTEQPSNQPKQAGDLRYECVISGEKEGTNSTTFVLLFHTDRKTYEEAVQVGTKTSQLDKGSYEKKGNPL